jgi:hypothetical protein
VDKRRTHSYVSWAGCLLALQRKSCCSKISIGEKVRKPIEIENI